MPVEPGAHGIACFQDPSVSSHWGAVEVLEELLGIFLGLHHLPLAIEEFSLCGTDTVTKHTFTVQNKTCLTSFYLLTLQSELGRVSPEVQPLGLVVSSRVKPQGQKVAQLVPPSLHRCREGGTNRHHTASSFKLGYHVSQWRFGPKLVAEQRNSFLSVHILWFILHGAVFQAKLESR